MNYSIIALFSIWISYAIYSASLAPKTAAKVLERNGYSQIQILERDYFHFDGCEPDASRIHFIAQLGQEEKKGYVCVNMILDDKIIEP